MTDRLHSCKESPDGRHHMMLRPGTVNHPHPQAGRVCRYCKGWELLDVDWHGLTDDPPQRVSAEPQP